MSLNVRARYGHTAVLLPGEKPQILIFGGRDARGEHTSGHYIIDILAALESLKTHDELLVSLIENLSITDELSSVHTPIWRGLGPFSDTIGSFNGTSNLWADRCRNVIYVLGQSIGDTRIPVDLFPSATNQALPYSLWALKFNSGWTSFEDISSYTLPSPMTGLSVADGDGEGMERWMWFGVLDSGLKVAQGDGVDEIDWRQVSSEPPDMGK